jgi:hypothetical protein
LIFTKTVLSYYRLKRSEKLTDKEWREGEEERKKKGGRIEQKERGNNCP